MKLRAVGTSLFFVLSLIIFAGCPSSQSSVSNPNPMPTLGTPPPPTPPPAIPQRDRAQVDAQGADIMLSGGEVVHLGEFKQEELDLIKGLIQSAGLVDFRPQILENHHVFLRRKDMETDSSFVFFSNIGYTQQAADGNTETKTLVLVVETSKDSTQPLVRSVAIQVPSQPVRNFFFFDDEFETEYLEGKTLTLIQFEVAPDPLQFCLSQLQTRSKFNPIELYHWSELVLRLGAEEDKKVALQTLRQRYQDITMVRSEKLMIHEYQEDLIRLGRSYFAEETELLSGIAGDLALSKNSTVQYLAAITLAERGAGSPTWNQIVLKDLIGKSQPSYSSRDYQGLRVLAMQALAREQTRALPVTGVAAADYSQVFIEQLGDSHLEVRNTAIEILAERKTDIPATTALLGMLSHIPGSLEKEDLKNRVMNALRGRVLESYHVDFLNAFLPSGTFSEPRRLAIEALGVTTGPRNRIVLEEAVQKLGKYDTDWIELIRATLAGMP